MVQSASTMSSVAAAIMANAAKEREETKRRQQEQAAANAQLRRPDETEGELDQFATSPVRDAPSNAAKASKRGPTQRELQDRRYGPGGREGELARRDQAYADAVGRNAAAKAKIKKRNEENRVDITKGRGYGGSRELGSALAEAREEGGQFAVDELLTEYFPEYAEQQTSGMKMNPTQAERKADQRRDANRRANNTRDFRETFGQDASSLRNRFGDDAPALMRQRFALQSARGGTASPGELMPDGFHRLDPEAQRLRVRRGLEEGRVTEAEMASLLYDNGDVSEVTGKADRAMGGALNPAPPFQPGPMSGFDFDFDPNRPPATGETEEEYRRRLLADRERDIKILEDAYATGRRGGTGQQQFGPQGGQARTTPVIQIMMRDAADDTIGGQNTLQGVGYGGVGR